MTFKKANLVYDVVWLASFSVVYKNITLHVYGVLIYNNCGKATVHKKKENLK